MIGFTPLEAAVLEAACRHHGEQGMLLRQLLSEATVTSRDNTGHGFYTEIAVSRAQQPVHTLPKQLDCPSARMLDMGDGALMGFILWLQDGYPATLEGYQLGDNAGATIDLKQRDLAALRHLPFE